MEERKWIFIEKSSDTVRYKVGDSDSSMDSEDYEYLSTKESPTPSTFEFIPSTNEEELPTSVDELEIHDNHFSSCPTSEVEDSDIEVVMKSPSSSETASLCSFNSQKSVPNDGLANYDEMIYSVEKPNEVNLDNEEDEDSEVEVISRSIHRNGSIEISYVAEINNIVTSLNASISLGSENENEDEVEETSSSKCIPSFPRVEEEEMAVKAEESDDEEQYIFQSSEKLDDTNHIESLEDYGIKYLLEDLHVSRQINGRLVGLKTSTLALTVCLSITLGVYLGNYLTPSGNNDADTILVPEDVVHSTSEDPLRVNITFKYSSSTKESLRSVLHSFRKLKNDYDRLHAVYADIKERCSLKKQMNFYWKKQAKKSVVEGDSNEYDSGSGNNLKGLLTSSVEKSNHQKERDLSNNTTSQVQKRTIEKLTRDLKKERKSVKYWKKKYGDIEFSKSNTCSKFDNLKSSFFSFSDCFNIFAKVIPSLDISAINITNRAESLAGHVQHAWNRLSGRWNAKTVQKDDPLYLRKVNRFRKIFIISNVVNSGNHIRNRMDSQYFENDTMEQELSCDDPLLAFDNNVIRRYNKQNESTLVYEVDTPGEVRDSVNSTSDIVIGVSDQEYDNSYSYKNSSQCYRDEINWYRKKFLESRFLSDVYKWKHVHQCEMDMAKSRYISRLLNVNRRQSKRIEDLHDTVRENKILKEKLKSREEYLEVTRKNMNHLIVFEKQQCNTSIEMVKATLRGRYSYLIKNIQNNMRKGERYKYNRKVRTVLVKERRKYDSLIRRASKMIRKNERSKSRRKLRIIMKYFERKRKRDLNILRMKYNNGETRRWNKTRQQHCTYKNYYKHLHRHKKHHRIKIRKKKRLSDRKNIIDRQQMEKEDGKRKTNKKRFRQNEVSQGGKRKKNNKKYRKEKSRKKYRSKYLKYVNGDIREEDYAYKYQKSVEELYQLKKVHNKVLKKNDYYEKEVKSYKRELDMYKEIIMKYEQKMKDVSEKEKEHELEILHLLQRMKKYNQITKENSRLKRTVVTFTASPSEKEVIYVDIKNSENSVEDVPTKNEETPNDFVLELSGSKCGKDPGRKPFYNINDVFPTDLFSRSVDIKPLSPSKALTILPTPVISRPDNLHISSSAGPVAGLFDSSSFPGDLIFSGSNESQVDREGNTYWDNGEVNEYLRGENLVINNWYINRMRERSDMRSVHSFNSEASEKEGYWFWKAMKEREKLRKELRSRNEDVSWFWNFMKGREKLRSSQSEELNWFLKNMEEREKLRSRDKDDSWFWKAMKEREKVRKDEEETY